MTNKEILIKARKLIEKPNHWIQGYSYRPPGRFCAMGAISQIAHGNADPHGDLSPLEKKLEHLLLRAVNAGWGVRFAPDWNDHHTHKEVLAAFDRAIEACDE